VKAEQLLIMAFPSEPKVERHESTRANSPGPPEAPRLVLVHRREPGAAWTELRRMLRTVPGLELRTDDQGGVWLREPDEWGLFEEAQRLFLEAMPEIEKTLDRPKQYRRAGRPLRITPPMVLVWRTARAWIVPNLDALKAAGWTTRRLFAAGRARFPHGEWGVAWASNWIKPGVKVELRGRVIAWTWKEGAMTRTQTAKP